MGEPSVDALYEQVRNAVPPVTERVPAGVVPVAPGIEAIYVEAGHMLGSASIQLLVNENGAQRKIVFSGDLGPRPSGQPAHPYHRFAKDLP